MIVEFTNLLFQTDEKVGNPNGSKEPHLINGVRYHWMMRSECMKINETLQEWIIRKKELFSTNPKYSTIDGIIICDLQGVNLIPTIGEDGKQIRGWAMIIRYAYLDNTKKSSKWDSIDFLKGLKGLVKPEIATLFESEKSHILNESDHWSVYIVECSDGTLYTGISNDVNKRVLAHNNGKGAKYTKPRLPVALKYSKEVGDRSEASKEEYRIKKLTREGKLELINEEEGKLHRGI